MFTFALLVSTVPTFPFPPSEAELALREMDAKITAAKSLKIEFTIDDSNVGTEQRLTTGTLVCAENNRFRCVLSGNITASVVSDGKRISSVFADPPVKKTHLTPEWFNEVLRSSIGRGGTFVTFGKVLAFAEASAGAQPGDDDRLRVFQARLLPSEKVDGVNAHVIEYELAWSKMIGDIDAAKVKVWLDPKTKLPLRRTMTFQFGADKKIYTAVHTKFELNPVIDEKLFELPK